MTQVRKAFSVVGLMLYCLFSSGNAVAQVFGNEWIDYSKTYYKLSIGPVGLPSNGITSNNLDLGNYGTFYRISYAQLQARGLENIPVEQFQLWRKGVEIPLFTSPASGVMPTNGYLEFWGEANDGNEDSLLYRNLAHQLSRRWNMFNDSLVLYLTVNPAGGNRRIVPGDNNVASSTLSPQSTINHEVRYDFRADIHDGVRLDVGGGKALYSSSFDDSEGYFTEAGTNYTINFANLFADLNAASKFRVRFTTPGFSSSSRKVQLDVNGVKIGETRFFSNFASSRMDSANVPIARLNTSPAAFRFYSSSAASFGLSNITLNYPRRLQFSNTLTTNDRFVFDLPSSDTGNLLRFIRTASPAANQQILVDLTNGRRYIGQRTVDTILFALPPSVTARKLVFYLEPTSFPAPTTNTVRSVPGVLTPTTFTNYAATANQGDYLIITSRRLRTNETEDAVEAFANLRRSALGGQYQVVVAHVEDLYDQFGYGTIGTPLAIRNFSNYARTRFGVPPKFMFIIGRGVTYLNNQKNETGRQLNLVPTWGHPASDNLLTASQSNSYIPQIPIGRLAAINGQEVRNYTQKVKDYLEGQNNPLENTWRKNVQHLIGGTDLGIINTMTNYMKQFERTIKDSATGAQVETYVRLNDPNTALNNAAMVAGLQSGTTLLTYFGHSSTSSLDFDLNNPGDIQYTKGRYPVFIANGCNASEFFTYLPQRLNGQQLTLSERYALQPNGGAIAFLSSTTFGVLANLGDFTNHWYTGAAKDLYGKSIGETHRYAMQKSYSPTATGSTELVNRLTIEQYHLQGDPAIKLFTASTPDYAFDEQKTRLTNPTIDLLTDTVRLNVAVLNLGKIQSSDSIQVRVTQVTPDGNSSTAMDTWIKKGSFEQSIAAGFPISGNRDTGTYTLHLTIDPNLRLNETERSNNTLTLQYQLENLGNRAGYPAPYAIVNAWPTKFYSYNGRYLADSTPYYFEMDTTIHFNSPIKYSLSKQVAGGVAIFQPEVNPLPNTVYYWRTALQTPGNPLEWNQQSFTYLPGNPLGYNQSHFYQFTENIAEGLRVNSEGFSMRFDSTLNNIYATQGIFPTSGDENGHFSVTRNGLMDIQTTCIGNSILFNVLDSLSFVAWENTPSNGRFNSGNSYCNTNLPFLSKNFNYSLTNRDGRNFAMNFVDTHVPNGNYVVMRLVVDKDPGQQTYNFMRSLTWAGDTIVNGSGRSLYHSLKNQGLNQIDSLTGPRTGIFIFKKGDTVNFKPRFIFSQGLFDRPGLSVDLRMPDTIGSLTTKLIGPAKKWERISWDYLTNAFGTDSSYVHVIGVEKNGREALLFRMPASIKDTLLSDNQGDRINAQQYPFLKLKYHTRDTSHASPSQVRQLRVLYEGFAEGSVLPETKFTFGPYEGPRSAKDVLYKKRGDSLNVELAFGNISPMAYQDSIPVLLQVEQENGQTIVLARKKIKALGAGETTIFAHKQALDSMNGNYRLYVSFNEGGSLPEVNQYNNFIYHPFSVDTVTQAATRNIKIFSGTGNWGDADRWSPSGVPVCGDSVIIDGDVLINTANAVARGLTVSPGATMRLNDASAQLTVGCPGTGATQILHLKGALRMNDGTILINGAMLVANNANFEQHGGTIEIDGNSQVPATSMQLIGLDSIGAGMPALFSIGGQDTAGGSMYAPFVSGQFIADSGTIRILNPPVLGSQGAAVFWGIGTALQSTKHHKLQFGSEATANQTGNDNGFSFRLKLGNTLSEVSFGTMEVISGDRHDRRFTLQSAAPVTIILLNGLKVADGGRIEIAETINLDIRATNN